MKKFFTITTVLFLFLMANLQSQTASKFVLLEEFSTTPCGFCPEGGIIAEQLIEKYPNLITYTHHAGFGTDSMTIPESKTIANQYTTFAPAAVIDRGDYKIPVYTDSNFIGISRQKWDSIVALRLSEPAEAQVDLFQHFDFSTRMLSVELDVKFLIQVDTNDYRINLAIVEDKVTGTGEGWDQKNYFDGDPNYPTLYKKGNPIVGYVHRHVLRALPTGTWGNSVIIPNNPETVKIYTYNLNDFRIPDSWKVEDINLVGFVSYYNANKFRHKILNSVQSKLSLATGIDEDKIKSGSINISVNPNPVSDISVVQFNNSDDNEVTIKIIDQLGNEVMSLIPNKKLNSGIQRMEFDSMRLSNGIYYCIMISGNKISKDKFVVVR